MKHLQLFEDFGNDKLIVYHRSNYLFNKFDLSKIGSGSGRKDNGYGLYFTDIIDNMSEYGDYLYQVILFNNKPKYNLLNLSKPLDKNTYSNIISSLYKHNHVFLDIDVFNTYYDYSMKYKDTEYIIWNMLQKEDTDLSNISLYDILDDKNKNNWFHISNYTNNNDIKHTFDELTSLNKVNFNNYDLEINDYGTVIYKKLSRILGTDKEASLFLLMNGVDGLIKSLPKTSNDYVIFDENDVMIEKIIYKNKIIYTI